MKRLPKLIPLTRTQMRIFMKLREGGSVVISEHRESTYEPLLAARLCYTEVGLLRITARGKSARIVHGGQVLP